MPVKHLHDDAQFAQELSSAGSRLVVADFFAQWCGPCRVVAPQFEQLSERYPNVVFLKIDVDEMQDTARIQGIRAMPTFLFFKNMQKVATVQGANVGAIESNIKQHATAADAPAGQESKDGMFDLASAIDKSKCECLNEADDHTFTSLFQDNGYLESDCDEQLIIAVAFNQPVKLHSLKFKTTGQNGPKSVKLFTNLPRTLDFDQATGMDSVQELTLSHADLSGEDPVPLKYVKFQNVQNLQIFIKDNQNGAETTRLDSLSLLGIPISATNMGDFKRVAGKKGETD
ncbi:thioredoxin-like protein 1 [Paramacrobiotus metropolitanus]|uniref:thioredoxin-like protein 1 n=1 Tax=Paramacrobiotus metropolitanus TaxID=2943436 RepID=UPI0024461531|nr:thioredoxin-like protein 1 [Paramacrobiotus metropolitanus]